MYHISISPSAQRELKKIKKIYKDAIKEAIDNIKEDPYMGKPLTRDLNGRFSYKVGIFRIVYKINRRDKIVEIMTAGHRSSVYN